MVDFPKIKIILVHFPKREIPRGLSNFIKSKLLFNICKNDKFNFEIELVTSVTVLHNPKVLLHVLEFKEIFRLEYKIMVIYNAKRGMIMT